LAHPLIKVPLTIGIAGLGTVGVGLLSLLKLHGERLGQMTGRPIQIVGVSARERTKDRGIDLSQYAWFDDPVVLANAPGIDVFIELMGGDEGVPRQAVEAALKAGKQVVTANKALLAKHGTALATLAEANGVELNFEAAVAGGIPVIKTLREALAANEVQRVYGILNGTCNYILTKMQEEGRPFASVLGEAQAKGYAEADPTFDIGGFDAAHKLTLLVSLAFGTKPALDAVHVEGIESITAADIEAADELGFRIKLLGVAQRTADGIEARVTPAMVAKETAIAQVAGVTNCVAIEGDFAGKLMLIGPGAGARATASAVASDILDIALGGVLPPFLTPVAQMEDHRKATMAGHRGAYYIRLSVLDKPGALATIAKRMGDQSVSLESIVQKRPKATVLGQASPPAQVIIVTHPTQESAIRAALSAIAEDGNVSERPQMIRIEKL
jgi:homoserine dehydrogenase